MIAARNRNLLGQQLTYQQMSQMSLQGLQNIILSHQQRVAEITADLERNSQLDPRYQYDNETVQMMLNEKYNLLAQIAAITAWLALSSNQRATTNPVTFLQSKAQQVLASFQRTQNYLNQPPNFLENIGEQLSTVLNTTIAGIPLYLAIPIVGAGVYLLFKK